MIIDCMDAEHALMVVRHFLHANDVNPPMFDVYAKNIGAFGTYTPRDQWVRVVSSKCKPPGWRDTWSGWFEDLTVLGVTAHEVAHHVDLIKMASRSSGWRTLQMSGEKPVSRYSHMHPREDFAESCMLMITNPTLLRDACPRRYGFIAETLGLRPVELRHWSEILRDSPRHVELAKERMR